MLVVIVTSCFNSFGCYVNNNLSKDELLDLNCIHIYRKISVWKFYILILIA